MEIKIGNLIFSSNFDSGNLARVERVPPDSLEEQSTSLSNSSSKIGQVHKFPINSNVSGNISIFDLRVDHEFKIWTRPDCSGTIFENGNRTWFHFSIRGYSPGRLLRVTIMNLNKQAKIYSQGYSPMYRVCHVTQPFPRWQRIRDKPAWNITEGQFMLTFIHRFSDLKGSTTFFAFCYPWTYSDTQAQLSFLDAFFHSKTASLQLSFNRLRQSTDPSDISESVLLGSDEISLSDCLLDKVYFHRELLCYSLEGRRIDLITLTDWTGRLEIREEYFDPLLFPNRNQKRPWKFIGKKVVMITARVHPGETPSSHVFNGVLEMLLRPNDARSCQLRRQYVFKLIPLLNPDGVFLGHYRTDTRGVNLNRVYLTPDFLYYPSIYACKALVVYHHTNYATKLPYAAFVDNVLHTISTLSGKEATSNYPGSPVTTQSITMTLTDTSQSTMVEKRTMGADGIMPKVETFQESNTCCLKDPLINLKPTGVPKQLITRSTLVEMQSLCQYPLNVRVSQGGTDGGPESIEENSKLIPLPVDSDELPSPSTLTSSAFSSGAQITPTDVPSETSSEITTKNQSIKENHQVDDPSSCSGLSVNQSSQPVKSAAFATPYLNLRPKTHNSTFANSTARVKRKNGTKWIKTPRSISAVGYRLNAIRNTCKSSRLVIALRNRKSTNSNMSCPSDTYTKWNAPLQQVIYSHAQIELPKTGRGSSKTDIELKETPKLLQLPAVPFPENKPNSSSIMNGQSVDKSLEHLEYLVDSESDFTPQIGLSQTCSGELRRMKKSAVRFETVNYEAVELQNFDGQLLTEDSGRKYLDNDLCKASPITCEPGNEGSDDDEPDINQDHLPTDQSEVVDDFNVNPQFLRLTDWIKCFYDTERSTFCDEDIKQLKIQSVLDQLIRLRRGEHLAEPDLRSIKPHSSGIAFYIDLHGHCSKRGCFLYGNWLESEDNMVDNVLYAVLVGVNSIHFDFNSCNFSLRNMYQKDRRGSLTKEGSGRVALWKHLGLIHCYTLECNYNTGPILNRLCRCLASAAPDETGRLTPPGSFAGPHWIDLAGSMGIPLQPTSPNVQNVSSNIKGNQTSNIPMMCFPQRYTPAHFEEVGRALLCGMLDLDQSNPWPRIAALAGPNCAAGLGNITTVTGMPEFSHMRSLREWVRKFVRGLSSCSPGGNHPATSKPSSQRSSLNQSTVCADYSRTSERNSVVSGSTSQKTNRNERNVNHTKMTPVSSGSPSVMTTTTTSVLSTKTNSSVLVSSCTSAPIRSAGSSQRGTLNPVRVHRPEVNPGTAYSTKTASPRQHDLMGIGKPVRSKWSSCPNDEHVSRLGAKLSERLTLDDHTYHIPRRLTQESQARLKLTENTVNGNPDSSGTNDFAEINTSNNSPGRRDSNDLLDEMTTSKRNPAKSNAWKMAKLSVGSEGDEPLGWSAAKPSHSDRSGPYGTTGQALRTANPKHCSFRASNEFSHHANFRRNIRKPMNLAESILMSYQANSRQRRMMTELELDSASSMFPSSSNIQHPGDREFLIQGEPMLKSSSTRDSRTNRRDLSLQPEIQRHAAFPPSARPSGSAMRYALTDSLHLPTCLAMITQAEAPGDAIAHLSLNHTPISLPDLERTDSKERSTPIFSKEYHSKGEPRLHSKRSITKSSTSAPHGLKKLWSTSGKNCGRLSQGKLKFVCTNHRIFGKSSGTKNVFLTSEKRGYR